MAAGAKKKGNVNESWIADYFTKWWGKPFKRMPTSGALRWDGADVPWTFGDIIPPVDFLGVIECKHYAYVDIDEILRKDTNKGMITWWWFNQLAEDIARCKMATGKPVTPILVWKMNNRPYRLCLELSFFTKLNVLLPHLVCQHKDRAPFVLLDLFEFFERVTPQQFREAVDRS